MGVTCSNIHIRKNDEYSALKLREIIKAEMSNRGFTLSDNSGDDVCTIKVYSPNTSNWVSFTMEALHLRDYEDIKGVAIRLVKLFNTDIIVSECIDSDWAYLGLFKAGKRNEGWINIGKNYDGKTIHKTNLALWKETVKNPPIIDTINNKQYIFAEEAIKEIAPMIDMDIDQAIFPASINRSLEESINYLYFKKTKESGSKTSTQLNIYEYGLKPCTLGKPNVVFVYNKGQSSQGIGILFTGDYIENNEITFDNISFESDYGDINKRRIRPIELKRVKCNDGKYGLYWEDKTFIIPSGVAENLTSAKLVEKTYNRIFGVRFTPNGNKKKVLDIMIHFIPLNCKSGRDVWYVYRGHKSKADYIKWYNNMQKEFDKLSSGLKTEVLNPDDFDI